MRRSRRHLASLIAWILLAAIVGWSFFPIAMIISSSMMHPRQMFSYPPSLVPDPFTLRNYVRLFQAWPTFTRALGNSVIITSATVVGALTLAVMAGYGFSRTARRRAKALKFSSLYLIVVRMLPPIVITIPMYPFLIRTGLFDSHATLVVLYVAFQVSLGVWILKAFFDDIPPELEEAAMVDGCSQTRAFLLVTMPLAKPGLVATAVFVGLDAWNEFLFALTFTSTQARTAPVIIGEMLGAIYDIDWGTVFAASTVQLLPTLIFLWAVERHLIRGMTMGAVKG